MSGCDEDLNQDHIADHIRRRQFERKPCKPSEKCTMKGYNDIDIDIDDLSSIKPKHDVIQSDVLARCNTSNNIKPRRSKRLMNKKQRNTNMNPVHPIIINECDTSLIKHKAINKDIEISNDLPITPRRAVNKTSHSKRKRKRTANKMNDIDDDLYNDHIGRRQPFVLPLLRKPSVLAEKGTMSGDKRGRRIKIENKHNDIGDLLSIPPDHHNAKRRAKRRKVHCTPVPWTFQEDASAKNAYYSANNWKSKYIKFKQLQLQNKSTSTYRSSSAFRQRCQKFIKKGIQERHSSNIQATSTRFHNKDLNQLYQYHMNTLRMANNMLVRNNNVLSRRNKPRRSKRLMNKNGGNIITNKCDDDDYMNTSLYKRKAINKESNIEMNNDLPITAVNNTSHMNGNGNGNDIDPCNDYVKRDHHNALSEDYIGRVNNTSYMNGNGNGNDIDPCNDYVKRDNASSN